MRVILTTFGTSGDFSPMLAIARALKDQGDDPVMVTNPYYEDRLASAEIEAILCGERLDPVEVVQDPRYTHKRFGPFNSWNDLFLPQVRYIHDAVRKLLAQASTAVVVNHPWCFGGFLAAEAAQVPSAMASLAPLVWYSVEDPSLYGVTRPPAWMHGWLMAGPMRWIFNGFFSRSLRLACRELGAPDHKRLFFDAMNLCALNLGLWSPSWRGPAGDDPPHAQLCGFPWGGRGRQAPPLDPALEAFLQAGAAPVVLGLGSVLPRHNPDVARALSEACATLGQRAVLVGVDPEQIPEPPEGQLVVPYAPYVSLFPRASVVVHHAGIGTLAEALCAGRPAIAIPFGHDQPDNAWRAERLGVSLTLERDRVHAQRLTEALRRCLEDDDLAARAAALGQQLAAEDDGARVAARLLRERFA